MKNLTNKELLLINGGFDRNAFMAGRRFAAKVEEVTGEVVHEVGDFFRGIKDGLSSLWK